MASPLSPNDLTRQQLDELDSLLQRMLSLPLTAPAAGAPVPFAPPPMPNITPAPSAVSGAWRSDGAAQSRMPYLAGDPAMVPLTPAMPALAALARGREIPPATWGPDPLARHTPIETPRISTVSTGTLRGVDAPALPAGYRTPEPLLPMVPVPIVAPEPPPAMVESHRIPVPLWPVFGVNWVLEMLLGLLGPVGTVLKHPAMKHLLGWMGVLLVIAAAVWSAKGQGWIALPWPR